jgi:deoxycytidylate deaminase
MLVVESKYREIARYIIFMKMAENLAKLSCDPKRQVGALLIKKDFKNVISIGINGTIPGASNRRSSMETGSSGLRHAERNCLVMANVTNPKEYMLFCTLSPCPDCAGDIAVAGIDTVYYKDIYPSGFKAGQIAMTEADINVESIWAKLNRLFTDIVHGSMVLYRESFYSKTITNEGVTILTKKYLEKFGIPFDDNLDMTDWKYDFVGSFTKYLYSVV